MPRYNSNILGEKAALSTRLPSGAPHNRDNGPRLAVRRHRRAGFVPGRACRRFVFVSRNRAEKNGAFPICWKRAALPGEKGGGWHLGDLSWEAGRFNSRHKCAISMYLVGTAASALELWPQALVERLALRRAHVRFITMQIRKIVRPPAREKQGTWSVFRCLRVLRPEHRAPSTPLLVTVAVKRKRLLLRARTPPRYRGSHRPTHGAPASGCRGTGATT